MMARNITPVALLATALFSLVGCSNNEVVEYEVPKSELDGLLAASEPAAKKSGSSEATWSVPEDWNELAPTSMRKGNFVFDGGDAGQVSITVTSFPGDTGGKLSNINRWRGQAGLAPIAKDALDETAKPVNLAGQTGYIADANPEAGDPTATRIVAAAIPFQGNTWFFKMTGPKGAVSSQEANFGKFLSSIDFSGTAPARAAAPAANAPENSHGQEHIHFDAPVGWEPSQGSSMRVASYAIPNGDEKPADFSITTFPGNVGGVVANVNRWRGQLGLGPWTQESVEQNAEKVNNAAYEISLFDLKAETDEEKALTTNRILVGILQKDQATWFFKLIGDAAHLELEKEALRTSLENVSFHQGEH